MALVESSKRSRRIWSTPFHDAHIEFRLLKIRGPRRRVYATLGVKSAAPSLLSVWRESDKARGLFDARAKRAAALALALAGGCFASFSACLGAGKGCEIPNFKGSSLGRFPLVLADCWMSDHLSERSRSVDAFSETRARGTLTLKRR